MKTRLDSATERAVNKSVARVHECPTCDCLPPRRPSQEFKVGDRVWVVCDGWDFVYFSSRSEPAAVIRVTDYGDIIVRFEQPRQRWADAPPMEEFGFQAKHLRLRRRCAHGGWDDTELAPPIIKWRAQDVHELLSDGKAVTE